MPDFLWLPHSVSLTLTASRARPGSSYSEGRDAYTVPGPATFAAFVEPKSAKWAFDQGHEVNEGQWFLVIAKPEDLASVSVDDLIAWQGRTLKVHGKPNTHDYGDGFTHTELVAIETTGGNRAP